MRPLGPPSAPRPGGSGGGIGRRRRDLTAGPGEVVALLFGLSYSVGGKAAGDTARWLTPRGSRAGSTA